MYWPLKPVLVVLDPKCGNIMKISHFYKPFTVSSNLRSIFSKDLWFIYLANIYHQRHYLYQLLVVIGCWLSKCLANTETDIQAFQLIKKYRPIRRQYSASHTTSGALVVNYGIKAGHCYKYSFNSPWSSVANGTLACKQVEDRRK